MRSAAGMELFSPIKTADTWIPLAAEIAYLGGGIVHAVGPAVIPAQRVFRAGRDAAAVVGGSVRQEDEQVAGSRAGVKIQQVACGPQEPDRPGSSPRRSTG